MGKKKSCTPRGRVRSTLRALWLRSRERASACKREQYTCEVCKRKQSKAKGKEFAIEVHHIDGVDWENLINLVYERLLVNPNKLAVLCKDCHKDLHEKI